MKSSVSNKAVDRLATMLWVATGIIFLIHPWTASALVNFLVFTPLAIAALWGARRYKNTKLTVLASLWIGWCVFALLLAILAAIPQ